ncbi:hypothetical protein [Phenylobacterium sp.]|uniref:hypothetical protein n=1 Tax=Phenylobacterium sp. TaxID=1871053 RepID=UPI0025E51081|nr:hypothetical protein [Phenylobacterium sp.]
MTAASVSLGFHLLLGLGLFLQHADAPFGAAGPDLGTGIRVSLVSGFAAGGLQAGSRNTATPEATRERDQLRPETVKVLSGGALNSNEDPLPRDPQEPTRPPSDASVAQGEAGQAAGVFEGDVGASRSQGGNPLAVSDLLAQIARCLKPDFRPVLGFGQLTLSIGPDGRLRVPPEVTSTLPQISPSDRLAADRIVQAALLCGPYTHPDALNRVISLPADFSERRSDARS